MFFYQEEDSYWKLAIGIIILFVEGLHALCYRKGQVNVNIYEGNENITGL
jgi:hypothetical protein